MGEGGGYSSEFSVGVCHPVPQILSQFQTKHASFPHRFQTCPLKSMPVFRPFLFKELVKLTRKVSSNDIFWIPLFLYYSFRVKKIDTFIRTRGSLENHTLWGGTSSPFLRGNLINLRGNTLTSMTS